MTTLLASAVRSGSFQYEQATVKQHVRAWLNGDGARHERVLSAFDSALVERRSSVVPIEEVFRARSFGASNDLYIRHAVDLATDVAQRALERAGVAPRDVDYFVSSSCTGFMIPSLDAHVAERLQMKPTLRRLPITEHGCAGGAVALAQAHDHLLAHQDHRVLVVSVELPSLTFQAGDRAPGNVVSSALFGDGAAAVVLAATPAEVHDGASRPRIVRTGSRRFEKSLDWMGFQLKDSGLHVLLSAEIPRHVRAAAKELVLGFLNESGLALADVDHFLFHPGGRKILEAFEQTLALPEQALAASRRVLRDHGNLSSATVLYIVDDYLSQAIGRAGEKGLLLAFGPGFGAELLLLEWS
jgi:alkylresorcinol/alkylpyrone synthase